MKKILGFVCALTLISNLSIAQTQNVLDSLQNVLKSDLNVKDKVDTYNLIANQYGESDSIKVAEYANKAIDLAKANDYLKGVADGLHHIAWNNYIKNNYEKATSLYTDMLDISKKGDYRQGEGTAYQGLGVINSDLGKYESALENYKISLQIKEEIDDKKGAASTYNSVAIIYAMQGNLDESLVYFTKMYDILKVLNNKFGIARSLNNIGIVYEEMGNYPKALEYYQKSLEIKDELNDKKGLASAYNNIGMIHLSQENYDLAFLNYSKSLELDREVGSKRGIGEGLINLGTIRQNQKKYDEASSFFEEAAQIYEESDYQTGIAEINFYLGKLYIELKEYKSAQYVLEKSLKINEGMGKKIYMSDILVYLGSSFYYQKRYNLALKHLSDGVDLAKKSNIAEPVKIGTEMLAKTYEALGDYKSAYKSYVTFKEMADSLFNESNYKKITQLSTQYTYEKQADSIRIVQEKEKAILNKEKELLEAKIGEQKATQITTQITLGLTFIIVLILVFSFRNQQKSNNKLNTANTELKSINGELNSANEKINQANEEIKTINDSLNQTLETVEKQRDDILSSINYAQRIQNAVLPSDERLKTLLPNHFILFKPRDVVSGDFYWFEEIGDKQFIVVADCTGHGIPGAFMTMLGTQALADIIIQKNIHRPDEILKLLDLALFKLLRKQNKEIVDGMDIVVCVYDKSTKNLEFAGAKNPMLIVQENELKEIKGDIFSINGYRKEGQPIAFKNHNIEINKPTTLYLYTDGFQDQFGGKSNKKFMKKRWKEHLLATSQLPITNQKEHHEQVLSNWMGSNSQVDDILVMGIHFS